MNLVFVHDTKFKEDTQGNYYTGGSYNQEVWNRYLNISSKLSVIARKDRNLYSVEQANQSYNYFNNKEISFIEVPNTTDSLSSCLGINEKIKIIDAVVSKCDFLIVRLPSSSGNIAVKAAKKFKKPYLVEIVACPWDAFWNHSIKGKIVAPFMYLETKKILKNAEYAIYVTNEFLQHRYKCNGNTIGCSDVELPNLDESVLEIRLNKIKNCYDKNLIVLGTLAAVNLRYKGQEYVIKAISKLNKEGYNFEYHLAGGGDNLYLKSVAEKYKVDDKVKFLGSLPHEDIFYYLDKLDIYIQPSKVEGLPRALVEAMSRGCPVLGSNVGGISELLNREFVFRSGSVNEICNILKKMEKNKMIEGAKRSFEKAKEYNKEILNHKRNMFYKLFANNVKIKK